MDLRPSILDDLGILATISWSCREFQKTYSDIYIERQIDIQENEVPDSTKTVIYRIIQEALNNISKHSKAYLVSLSLKKREGAIELTIQDNGRGFDLREAFSRDNSRRGMGLGSMSERSELSGGFFEIESIRGKGTTIRVTWKV
jgi:signal transduction histidine kinase